MTIKNKIKTILLLVLGLLFVTLAACNQTETDAIKSSEVDTNEISFDTVINAIEKQKIKLNDANSSDENVFIQNLNGVIPEVYSLKGKILSIYVFHSTEERKKGMMSFEELTADKELVIYEIFTNKNVLIFYVTDNDDEIEMVKNVREIITNLD